jgi:hypothetical protein
MASRAHILERELKEWEVIEVMMQGGLAVGTPKLL